MARPDVTAVLGAGGTMGFAIARNVARAGIPVRAWNRTLEKARPLERDGATVAPTPAAAAAGAGVVLTMLSDADAVLAGMQGEDGALSSMGAASVWLQMSTIGESGTEECMSLAQRHRVAFVDAPVLGTRQPAEEGQLVVMPSGPDDEQLRGRLEPIFDAVGQRTIWVGEAGMGTRLKLVTNTWLLAVVEGTAETIALAQGFGVDPEHFFQAIDGGPLDVPYMRIKARAILEGDFTPSFRLALAAKDARLAEQAAERRGLDLPLLSTIHQRMEQGVPEHGDEDLIATYLTSAASISAAAETPARKAG
jgi:3-hydroxyisobutyrate dehydrogenase